MSKKHPTEDDLAFDIAKTARQVDGTLTARQYDRHGEYTAKAASNKFGSWNKAKLHAGVPRNQGGGKTKQLTDEELLQDLRDTAEKVDGYLSQDKYNEHGKHSSATFYERFESFLEAKKEAGIDEEPYSDKKISDEELLDELEKGKSIKAVAEDAGYGKSGSSTLSQRIKSRGWSIRNKIAPATGSNNKGMILSINEDDVEEAGLDPSKPVYYEKQVDNGSVTLNLYHRRVDTDTGQKD